MTAEPLTAALDQLAAHHERISHLDNREAGHYSSLTGQLTQLTGTVTAIGHTLADETAALARLEALQQRASQLSTRPGPDTDGGGYEPGRRRHGGSSPTPSAGNRPPGCAPGSMRSTAPVTGTWPPRWGRAGRHTTCACTGWTSSASCGRRCTCRTGAAPGCCRPRPNTRPASCPPSPPS
jgi:hypothetical protein